MEKDLPFIKWAIKELGIKTQPRIKIGDDHARAQEVRALGYYNPNENSIWVLRGTRVTADWYRTLSHELVHWKQREDGVQLDGSDGSSIEDEANAKAAVLLRKWGREHPEIYEASLNEQLKVACSTPGAQYSTVINDNSVEVNAILPHDLELSKGEASDLKKAQ